MFNTLAAKKETTKCFSCFMVNTSHLTHGFQAQKGAILSYVSNSERYFRKMIESKLDISIMDI
ncbi:hypothetical protein LBK6_02985 [Leptospira borgpetersenii serovar Hardjo]|nr:hypothetical protein LBK6_02985 [Leptospira borgpetersenii serovar Hardjo]AWV69276.1 hypothetical protein B9T54_03200 [Leptospira borgpetersenii serovar Hardjo-bovis]TQE53354.1 hypothetical protein FFZ95_07555 [Leptospira borgpetersenii]AMX60607.1 hypothetical protein LBK9_02930 [Leptospira borgpetersenii serovar Hardjo]AMX63853.1 hypothetical protein LBK30_02985 [Leptospira borgpetersenii serovar Hardjo]